MLRITALLCALSVSACLFADAPVPHWPTSTPVVPPPPPVVKVPHPSWPKTVPVIPEVYAYRPTRVSQRIAVTNGLPSHQWYDLSRDDVFANVPPVPTLFNPNRQSPYRVSGGMEGLHGWQSVKMTNVTKNNVRVWNANIPISGAGRALPGFKWQYPDNTVFVDLLVNDHGEAFELRTRTKEKGEWKNVVAFEDAAKTPAGYKGAGKACASCHRDAGNSLQYGIMVRGDDGVFSYNPLDR